MSTCSIIRCCVLATALMVPPMAAWGQEKPPAGAQPESSAAAPAASAGGEHWAGEIALPTQKLRFALDVVRDGEKLNARMAIPQQGLKDPVELKDVSLEGKMLKFTFGVPPMPPAAYARFSLLIDNDAGTASGTMTQGGVDLPVTMKRLAAGEKPAGPNRPQNPRPPFPYEQREVVVTSGDGAKLPGTLTVPSTPAPAGGFPAVSLITGSGLQDRDESLMDHRPFAVLADALSRRGIVVLRVDDRGWNNNANPAGENATTDTYADDALACVALLKGEKSVNPKLIGLVGHSEGGLIAPMVAAKSADVAFIVLLAGTGVPGKDVIDAQATAIMKAEGQGGPQQEKVAAARRKAFDLIGVAGKEEQFEAALGELVREQLLAAGQKDEPELVQQGMIVAKKQLGGAWMKRFLTLDPREALRKTACPVLALNGSLDMQVLAWQNIPLIAAALMEAGNPDVTIRVLPGLNHLFQHARTGGVSEYQQIEETMSPEVLEMVGAWILQRRPRAEPAK